MKFKNLVSAVSALAVAGSVFAGLAVTASATSTSATLDYTGHACYGDASGYGVGLNSEKEHFNREASSGYMGYAFAKFDFTIPEGESVSSATLTWSYDQGGSQSYTSNVYYLNPSVDSDLQTGLNDKNLPDGRFNNQKTVIATTGSMSGNNATHSMTTDVTSALQNESIQEQGYVVFQWTANNGGADLHGKTSSEAPTLVIESSAQKVYTVKFLSGAEDITSYIKIYSDEGKQTGVNNGSLFAGTTYYYSGTRKGYSITDGSFTIDAGNIDEDGTYHVDVDMQALAQVNKLTVSYNAAGQPLTVTDVVTFDPDTYYVGDSYTFYAPIYVEDNGVLYKVEKSGTSDSGNNQRDKYERSVPLNASDATYSINVTAVPDAETYQFIDYNENDPAARAQTFSKGKVKTITGAFDTLTVEADGIYTVLVTSCGNANKEWNDNKGSVEVKNGENLGDLYFYTVQQSLSQNNVALHNGDIITVNPKASGTSQIDYVLIIKTGELPAEPELPEDVTVASGGENVNEGHEDAASMWQALINGTGKSYSKVTANVTLKNDGGSKSATVDTGAVVTGGDVNIIVVVNKLVDDIEKIVISVE